MTTPLNPPQLDGLDDLLARMAQGRPHPRADVLRDAADAALASQARPSTEPTAVWAARIASQWMAADAAEHAAGWRTVMVPPSGETPSSSTPAHRWNLWHRWRSR